MYEKVFFSRFAFVKNNIDNLYFICIIAIKLNYIHVCIQDILFKIK